MHYFAYGSNMSLRRLRARVPSAQPLGHARLHGHRMVFHKVGRDGSAKCDILGDDGPDRCVHGVLYRMHADHRPALDAAEGLGHGYGVRDVELLDREDRSIRAFTYVATHTDASLRPYPWYLHHVLAGAREHDLPADYIAAIAAVVTIDDPDDARSRSELAIYG